MPDTAQTVSTANTGRSWGKTCCLGCFLPVLALALALVVGIRVLSGPGAKQISALPSNYPADLQIYRLSDARAMTYLPGTAKGKMIEFVSAPIKWFGRASSSTTFERSVKEYASRAAGMDRVTVAWTNLSSTRSEVLDYYTKLFASAGLSSDAVQDEKTGIVLAGGSRADAVVQFSLDDTADAPGIDEMILMVDYIPKP